MGILRKDLLEFEQEKYINEFLPNLSNEELKDEYDKQFVYREDLQAEYDTNNNMISRFIDSPQYEHLIDMSIRSTPTSAEIALVEFKINCIKHEFESRGMQEEK